MTEPALLRTQDVVKRFGALTAVDHVSITVPPGTITAVIGPNGAGKSTLFNAIAGTVRPDAGRITFADRDITGWPAHQVAAVGLTRTFQSARIFTRMTVLDNLMLAAGNQPGERLWRVVATPRRVRRGEQAIAVQARELLVRLQLDHLADQYAKVLSGGQRRLLEFARVMMAAPRLVLLDEPLAGVNPTLGNRLLQEITEMRDRGVTFLLIEHDLAAVMSVSDVVVVMAQGAVIAVGTPDQVRADERVVDAYLGTGDPDTQHAGPP